MPHYVTTDDYLLFNNGRKSLEFDSSDIDTSLWSPFMEKMFAKANGNYDSISGGGYGNEPYAFILGAPGNFFSTSNFGYSSSNKSSIVPAAK